MLSFSRLTPPPPPPPHREVSGGLGSTAASPRCRRAPPTTEPECTDSHELETLMPLSGQQGAGGTLEGAPEEQGLMAGLDPGGAGGHPTSEAKVRERGGEWLMNTLHRVFLPAFLFSQ